ncbi:MAG: hypothetical protein ACK40G_11975 [Cytophagaceae bacterium]
MLSNYYFLIAGFYVFVSGKYFFEIKRKPYRVILALFFCANLIYFFKVFLNIKVPIYAYSFIPAIIISGIIFIISIFKRPINLIYKFLIVTYALPIITINLLRLFHWPDLGLVVFKWLSLLVWIGMTLINRKVNQINDEVKIMNLFAVELILMIVS